MNFPIFSLSLLSIIGMLLFIDIIPICKDWLNRIHIGRYNEKKKWEKSITSIGVSWLKRTPIIKVTDNTRLIAIDMLKRNYKKSTIQQWQVASLLLGLTEYLKYNQDKEVEGIIMKFLNSKFYPNGQWIKKPLNVDGAILAYAVLKLNFMDPDKFKKAFDYIWEMIKEHVGKDGTVKYRKSMKDYRYVDTIGLICPFLLSYGIKYNKKECIDLALKQIKQYEQFGMLDKHWIPCHAYKIDNNVPLGLYGWGRGLGWFALGLIDTWNELPQTYKEKDMLVESIKKISKAAIYYQQKNGSWNWSVTRNESRPDSSATAILAWFLLNASKIDNISNECLVSTNKAINYLMRVTRRNGAVDFSQGDTKDIGVYSMLFNILPFTQGICIRLINLYNNSKVV